MKTKLLNFENKVIGDIALNPKVFGIEPRSDIVKLVVDWQRAKAMAGTHHAKTISDVSGTTKKPFKQKGTGNARQGSLRSVQMRGGGVAHGPVVRSHATDLPKKVRKLGLRSILSSKFSDGKILLIDSFVLDSCKTIDFIKLLKVFGEGSFFFIDGEVVDNNLKLACRNVFYANVVPQIGANVYDIMKHDYVLISKTAIESLEERLG